jgi:transcriptional regulator with XRE-family HTH domain
VFIGERIRTLREERNLSQGDIESRTGLLRCYISRVENGYTVPSITTLEKLARALEVKLYQLLYDGNGLPPEPASTPRKKSSDVLWGTSGKDARFVNAMRLLLSRMDENDRKLLLPTAIRMAQSKKKTDRPK